MKKRSLVLGISIVLACSGFAKSRYINERHLFVDNIENVLGTSLEIKIATANEAQAEKAENLALKEIDRLNKILSSYDLNSESTRWMNAPKTPVKISPELFDILSLFETWRVRSNGALDASAATFGNLWQTAAKQQRIPTHEEISAALTIVRQPHYILDASNKTALRVSDATLAFNSFAKSYIMNKAVNKALAIPEVNGIVLNIGGDIIVRGKNTEVINIRDPKADAENDPAISTLQIADKTVATSGNYRRGEFINGKWYSHIIDPRTGLPADQVISATVVANNAVDAGALATSLNVLTPKESEVLVAKVPGAEFMLITANGRRVESAGWKKYELKSKSNTSTGISIAAADKMWDQNFEVAINLELATIEGMRVHRPFVAVWVVDAKKNPVRQIALWYNKPRWLNEMSSWYNTYYDAFSSGNSNISSTTSATRSAGKYMLKWDGKDDKGNYVKQGTYTIYIEAAREHGSHQLMTQEIDTKKEKHIEIQGNEEISSASLDYRRKADGK